MRIMLTDRTETSAALAEQLTEAGHDVFDACLPEAGHQHECAGLRRGRCPLHAGVDLAIATTDRDQDVASAGTVCARRSGIRVLSLGQHDARHPDLESVIGHAAGHGDETIAHAVQRELERTLELFGHADGTVEVIRTADNERIVATIPSPLTISERSRIAVRLLDAATGTGRGGERRDVAVRSPQPA